MPSVILKSLPPTLLSLSDDQLLKKLKAYNPNYGPILPSTRNVYLRKLFALETGQDVEACGEYPPADGDEEEGDDGPGVFRSSHHTEPKRRINLTETKAVYTAGRYDIGKPSPRRPLHPDTKEHYYPRSRGLTPLAKKAAAAQRGPLTSRARWGLPCPVWAIALAVVVCAFFTYLVFRNLESEPASSVPDEIEMNV